jgi:DNA-binding transcriptional LysR family regulator
MNIKHAQYVLAILRAGSITEAAKQLYISQPSLSQTIRQAEQQLGTPIFNRDVDPMTLTYAGQMYVQAARQIMNIDTNLLNEIEEIKKESHGRMRLGFSVQRGMQLLPLVIPEFIKKYPHVKIELQEQGSDTLEQLIIEGVCDLALITTSPKRKELNYTLLESEEIILMADKNTRLARRFKDGEPIDILEAEDELFVTLRHGHSIRSVQDHLFNANRMAPRVLLESNSLELAKRVAAASGAVMLCPYVYIAQSPEVRSKVNCYPIKNMDYTRHLYLCYRKEIYFTRFMEDFLEIVRSKL